MSSSPIGRARRKTATFGGAARTFGQEGRHEVGPGRGGVRASAAVASRLPLLWLLRLFAFLAGVSLLSLSLGCAPVFCYSQYCIATRHGLRWNFRRFTSDVTSRSRRCCGKPVSNTKLDDVSF